ncbi:MAG: L,D-transpeptidase family protein, partial [Planctomycetota bacterium]
IKFVLYVVMIAVCCVGCLSESRIAVDCTSTFNTDHWRSHVGDGTGIWVSIEKQEAALIDNHRIVKRYRCSTAANGAGNRVDSGRTPLGWHTIGAKIGDGLQMGAVLKDRQWTGQVWKGEDTEKDLILSRILWLEGLQDGVNRGGNVDSYSRYIYIHGTNAVNELGRPASAGCVRLDPVEVIDLYDRVEAGTCVLITKD